MPPYFSKGPKLSKIGRRVKKHAKLPPLKKPDNKQLVRLIRAVFCMLESTESNEPTKEWIELANALAPFLRIANNLGTKIK